MSKLVKMLCGALFEAASTVLVLVLFIVAGLAVVIVLTGIMICGLPWRLKGQTGLKKRTSEVTG
jgi:hypothetical protein